MKIEPGVQEFKRPACMGGQQILLEPQFGVFCFKIERNQRVQGKYSKKAQALTELM